MLRYAIVLSMTAVMARRYDNANDRGRSHAVEVGNERTLCGRLAENWDMVGYDFLDAQQAYNAVSCAICSRKLAPARQQGGEEGDR